MIDEDPRSLAGELLTEEDLEKHLGELRAEQEELQPLFELTTHPGWRHLDELMAREEEHNVNLFVGVARSPVEMLALRGRIASVRWLRALPDKIVDRIGEVHSRMEELTEEDEPDA